MAKQIDNLKSSSDQWKTILAIVIVVAALALYYTNPLNFNSLTKVLVTLVWFVVAGGVAANGLLRDEMSKLEDELNIKVRYPAMKHCTDNAAMIAYLGSLKTPDMVTQGNSNARPRWPLNEV